MIVIRGGYTVTMDPRRTVHERGCVMVDEAGAIAWVGALDACPGAAGAEVIDATGMMVLPGFVNAGHLLVGETPGGPQGDTARIACQEMLRGGTTTSLLLHPHEAELPDIEAAVRASALHGLRHVQALPFRSQACAAGPQVLPAADREASRLAALMDALGAQDASGRLDWAVQIATSAVDIAAGLTGEAAMNAASALASARDLRLVTESSAARAQAPEDYRRAMQRLGRNEITHLMELGLLDDRWLVTGGEWLTTTDLRLMTESGCHGVYSPLTEAMRGRGTGPWAQWIAAGGSCAVATGDPRLHGCLDLLEQAKAALMIQNTLSLDASALTAEACLEMVTLGGARALGLADRVGSLEAGKRADIVLFDLQKPYLQVAVKPISALVACAGAIDVHTVLIDGIVRLRHGRMAEMTQAQPA